ncbi:major facilitator superfamily domain-containing protein [Biscogniauxia marginata]|nr:major facilitator superfamily domain-containing protein [Biscogniauxia marginata]
MEAAKRDKSSRIPWHKMLTVQGYVTPGMLSHEYRGAGTEDDPYLVTFLDDDPRDPMRFSPWLRWTLCLAAGYVTFSVAFISSAYASGVRDISRDLEVSPELVTLGLSLFLIGFVLGPFVWAPASELFGRQHVLILSAAVHVVLNIATCFCKDLSGLLLLRFLSGAFGASPLTNSGAVIADTFPPKERGLAITVYALVPLFAPVLGPIVGEFVAGTLGWRWLMGLMALLSASALLVSLLLLPETYAPVILRKRAQRLKNITGRVFVSAMAVKSTNSTRFASSLATTFSRPFLLAAHEPIIVAVALYQAVVFGSLYLTFSAFPMVYTDLRGWPQESSGLSFIGVMVGILFSVVFQFWDNSRYVRLVDALGTQAAPAESRLPGCCIGGISIVVGLFWFAWTTSPDIPWMINMAAGVPFGFGIILVTIGLTNYLIDSYAIFAASALTVCICGRAICGAVFPLFVRSLFANLGVNWGLSIPAFLSLLCVPIPFVFYRYGPGIRARCKYALQAEMFLQQARRPITEGTRLLSGHNNTYS